MEATSFEKYHRHKRSKTIDLITRGCYLGDGVVVTFYAGSSRALETKILQETDDIGWTFQETAQEDHDMGRSEEEMTVQRNVNSLKRDDWRSHDYWWCETNKTVHVEKHCSSCKQMAYNDILKKMQEVR